MCLPYISLAQDEDKKKDYGKLSGGLESNSQYYVDDAKTGDFEEEDNFRSNTYLRLNYDYKNWFANIQVESYEPQALLSYYPKYEGTDIGTFAIGYKSNSFEATVGHFYEQFGSGLILRSWEDRQLGINNALRGANVKFRPTESIELTALYGRQRDGFEVSRGDIYGFNSEINLSDLFKFESTGLGFGFSYVARSEDLDIDNPDFNATTNSFSGRLDYSEGNFYSSIEYVSKSEDVFIENDTFFDDKYFDGNALLLNFGYAKSGLGIDATFRRMENMSFYSQRNQAFEEYTQFNQGIVNYLPALTKQHDYSLTNIYVYQAQPNLKLFRIGKAGEIGGQIDVFYKIKKGSTLGGKYGTKLAFNYANWYGLKGDYNTTEGTYETSGFLGFGEKFYRDMSLEIRKKISKNWSSIFTVVNTYYNKEFVEDTAGEVNATVLVGEATHKFGSGKSIRVEAQHLFTNDDMKNWAGGTLEFNLNSKVSMYVTDIYNYGNDDSDAQIHYYNFGGSYSRGATRVGASYGRQRGGLLCVGGVCRIVPEITGFTLNLSTSF
ncbi:hypothetical protein A9Q87_02085 [Flavobacteriales bacterium 34_180_T64]|nr:hypothetical protein A9Q87_02085 [Flavobacteriales bacterium 34_180_T64]